VLFKVDIIRELSQHKYQLYKMATSNKRRKLKVSVPEITFDDTARAEYLTGFHKRKLARIRRGEEVAAKKERDEKIRDRALLRQRRKEELELHVSAVEEALRMANGVVDKGSVRSSSDEEWDGFTQDSDIEREDEYIDEERYTTVKVETVGISRDGFTNQDGEYNQHFALDASQPDDGRSAVQTSTNSATKRQKAKKPSKKRNFRYEAREERLVTRARERIRHTQHSSKRRKK